MADLRISDLTQVSNLNNGDFVEVSQENAQAQTGYTSMKANMTDLGNKFANSLQFTSALQTTAKTIIGAINELFGRGLSNLPDTNIQSATSGQVLAYDGSKWANSSALEFQKGDTFNLENIWCCGCQGNSSTRSFYIPLPKEYSSSLTVSVTAVVSAYTFSGASETWNNNTLSSLGTVSYLKARNGVVVLVALTTPASTTQYTPLTVRIASGTLSFS